MALLSLSLIFFFAAEFSPIFPFPCLFCPKNEKACVCFRRFHQLKIKWVKELSVRRSGCLPLCLFIRYFLKAKSQFN